MTVDEHLAFISQNAQRIMLESAGMPMSSSEDDPTRAQIVFAVNTFMGEQGYPLRFVDQTTPQQCAEGRVNIVLASKDGRRILNEQEVRLLLDIIR